VEVRFTPRAAKQVASLDPQVARRIRRFLTQRVLGSDDPLALAKRLVGEDDIWRWRVGDYRILFTHEGNELILLVVEVGHRRDVYR